MVLFSLAAVSMPVDTVSEKDITTTSNTSTGGTKGGLTVYLCFNFGAIDVGCDDPGEGDDTPTITSTPTATPTTTPTATPRETRGPPEETPSRTHSSPAPQPRESPSSTTTSTSTVIKTERLPNTPGSVNKSSTTTPSAPTQTTSIRGPTHAETASTTRPPTTSSVHPTDDNSTTTNTAGGHHNNTHTPVTKAADDQSMLLGRIVGGFEPGLIGLGVMGIVLAGLVGFGVSNSAVGLSWMQSQFVHVGGVNLFDRGFEIIGQLWWVCLGARRSNPQRLLENDARRALYKTLTVTPGQTLTAVAQETEYPRGTIERHARVLVHAEILSHVTQQGSRRYYPTIDDTLTADVQTVIAAEEHGTKADILNAIREIDDKPTTTTAIAETLTYDISTVRHHLNRLEADGLIERARRGEKTAISFSDAYADIINWLITY